MKKVYSLIKETFYSIEINDIEFDKNEWVEYGITYSFDNAIKIMVGHNLKDKHKVRIKQIKVRTKSKIIY